MPEIPADELNEIYRFAISLGKYAGQILLDSLARRRSSNVEESVDKLNAVDIVTQTDHGMPCAVVDAFPPHRLTA